MVAVRPRLTGIEKRINALGGESPWNRRAALDLLGMQVSTCMPGPGADVQAWARETLRRLIAMAGGWVEEFITIEDVESMVAGMAGENDGTENEGAENVE